MRDLAWALILLGAAVLAFFALLPVLGIIAVVIAAAVLLMVAAPLLQRLPWFRDRIRVEQRGGFRSYQFGNTRVTTYHDTSKAEAADPGPREEPLSQLDNGDVIDVEGKEIPERNHS